MPSRALILGKIKSALRTAAPRPPAALEGTVFAPLSPVELRPRFESEFQTLKGEFHASANWEDAQNWIKKICAENSFSKVAAAPHHDIIEATRSVDPQVLTGQGDCGAALSHADLGVSSCDCLVARTGSIVLTTHTGFGRALSVLPPAHLVVARASVLVAELKDAYSLLQSRYSKMYPSMMTIISGPSRTSDIEKLLVLGAHGPKRLFILLLDF